MIVSRASVIMKELIKPDTSECIGATPMSDWKHNTKVQRNYKEASLENMFVVPQPH